MHRIFFRSIALKNIPTFSRVRERVWHLLSLIQERVEILHFVLKRGKRSFSKGKRITGGVRILIQV